MLKCRICLDDDYRFNLLKPCSCSGTIEFVHRNCLVKWLQHRRQLNPNSDDNCEICKKSFNVDNIEQYYEDNLGTLRLYIILSIIGVYLLYYVIFTGHLYIVIHSGVLADADIWPFQKADGYVNVCLDGYCGCTTKVITDSEKPTWDSECKEWSNKSVFIFSELTLKIYDSDFGTDDDFLGEVKISISQIFLFGPNGSPVNYTWTDPVHGSIIVSVQWMSILSYLFN